MAAVVTAPCRGDWRDYSGKRKFSLLGWGGFGGGDQRADSRRCEPKNGTGEDRGMAARSESIELNRSLGLFDATTIVMGSMIGSGVFIVAADIGRQVQSPGLLLMTWVATAALTLIAALSYGELAAMM